MKVDSTGNLVLYETLLRYHLDQPFFRQTWNGPGDQIKTINFGTFILGSYIETLIGRSICGGNAVRVIFSINYCTTNLATTKTTADGLHVAGIQHVQKALGVGSSPSCPGIASSIKSNSLFIVIHSALFGLYWMLL